jgi:hypothetical protein
MRSDVDRAVSVGIDGLADRPCVGVLTLTYLLTPEASSPAEFAEIEAAADADIAVAAAAIRARHRRETKRLNPRTVAAHSGREKA